VFVLDREARSGKRARLVSSWRLIVAAGTVIAAGGGAAVAVGSSGFRAVKTQYAITPTSSGEVNPTAVPLGDGYVSSSPKVGYVDSCTPSFCGVGPSHGGPWINTQAATWNYLAKPRAE
jgi:hypothetical protein